MNLQQQERFYQFMNRVKANERSRAASTTEDVRYKNNGDGKRDFS